MPLDLSDPIFRFQKSAAEKLFNEISEVDFFRIEVSSELSGKIDELLEIFKKNCTFQINGSDNILYRARKHDYEQCEKFLAENMGAPPSNCVHIGRAQLAGVSVLYLADSAETAIAEVRPDIKELITVGEFNLKSKLPLKILDLNRFRFDLENFEEFNSQVKILNKFVDFSSRAFSSPVHFANPKKYLAHNYFVQRICDLGYAGIGYRSAVKAHGKCYAIFDGSCFECTTTELHEVKALSISTKKS